MDEGDTVPEDGSIHEELGLNATLIECSLGTYDEDGAATLPSTDKEYDQYCDCVICGKRKEYATWKATQLSKKTNIYHFLGE